MKHINKTIANTLVAALLLIGCNPEKEKETVTPEPEAPQVVYHFYVSGKINGEAFYWKVDTANFTQALSPYNSRKISADNNLIRYGTRITSTSINQMPYLGVEFNVFQGNSSGRVSVPTFQSYFKTGNYPFSTNANKDNSLGINIIYEKDANYTDQHESYLTTQPSSSYFTIDSVSFVQKTTNHAYLKARFAATLRNNNGVDPDVVITDGVFRIFVDNSLEE